MKYLNLATVAVLLTFFGCGQNQQQAATKKDSTIIAKVDSPLTVKLAAPDADKTEIQSLIRKTLNWAEKNKDFQLLPALTDSKDSTCTGFDMAKLKANLGILKSTGFFSQTFIENYNQIILTLDKKVKNKEFEKWNTYELPTFSFANDVDPWCECQDSMSYDAVEIEVIKLDGDKANLIWKWGGLTADTDKSWKDFSYKFKVEKENGRWKIAYLQGFDFAEAVKKG